jgi:large subunit ribosomal protein L13
MKTFSPKPEHIERRWYVVDADGAVLGRLATQVATVLRGKHKPIYAPHADTGDHVIVINAGKVVLSGNKLETKIAYRHSGYPGGLTEVDYGRLMATRPERAVEKAIKGMLPKNRLGRTMARKLIVYPGADHHQQAQKPEALALGEFPKWDGLPVPQPKPKPAPKSETRPGRARAASKKAAAKKAPARKAAAKQAPTKKAAAKPATAKKAASKRAAKKES